MTAEEYVKHYASGQGGYESVPIDIALRAIEYAKQETKQHMMKDAIDTTIKQGCTDLGVLIKELDEDKFSFGDKIKVIIIKSE